MRPIYDTTSCNLNATQHEIDEIMESILQPMHNTDNNANYDPRKCTTLVLDTEANLPFIQNAHGMAKKWETRKKIFHKPKIPLYRS